MRVSFHVIAGPTLVCVIVDIDLTNVRSWDAFHSAFASALGFMDGYGRNMNAWIDCLTYVDEDEGTSSVVLEPGDVLTLQVRGARALRATCPDIYAAFIDSAAFVNWRRIEVGERAILALSYR